jgi:hypothetical protein
LEAIAALPLDFINCRLVMRVYYADTVEQVFRDHVASPTQCFSSICLAAQDAQGQSFYLVDDSSFYGLAKYQEHRYHAQKLTGASNGYLQPPSSPYLILAVHIFCLTRRVCYLPTCFLGGSCHSSMLSSSLMPASMTDKNGITSDNSKDNTV